MNKLIASLIMSAAFSVAGAEERFHEFTSYKVAEETPIIPGSIYRVHQGDRPQPKRVIPPAFEAGEVVPPPSDAIVLFDGGNLDQFRPNGWLLEAGVLTAGKGGLVTKDAFGDCQFHIVWRAPNPPTGKPSRMGNSGIYFMWRYELQIFDSYSCEIYADGSAGAIYGQTPPLVNASRPPGEWQTFDVIFEAPRFEGDKLIKPAYMTVFHNGILVQDHTELFGGTTHKSIAEYSAHPNRLPLLIQGDKSPVQFKQIWIREL
ncbi:MAG: DUF1080 domain-containing protein [Verrucomicrobiota bacterium]